MKKLIIIFLLIGCSGKDDPQPPTNSVEEISIDGHSNVLQGAVERFYYVANNDKVEVEKGFTITTFSAPEPGDQSKINGKVMELDREFISSIVYSTGSPHALHIYMAKQIGSVLFAQNLTCVNKVDFENQQQLRDVKVHSDGFIKSVSWNAQCPI